MSRTRSCGRHRRPQPRRLEGDPAALRADDLAAADPGIRSRATSAVFYGRAAHVAGTQESHTERHRQLTLCRAAVTACGGQETAVYLGDHCCADHPWSRRTLLSAPGRPADPAWTRTAAGAWHLLPRRAAADGTGILPQLAQRHVLFILADTGNAALTAQEHALPGRLMSGIASSAPALRHRHPIRCHLRHGMPPGSLAAVNLDEHRPAGPRPGTSRPGQEIRLPRPGLHRG